MTKISRRKWIKGGLAVTAGAAGIAVAAKVADSAGLIPPDAGMRFGAGETLTYATQRLLTRHSMAREFSQADISKHPFANPVDPLGPEFERLLAGDFAEWRLKVDGMVEHPSTFTLAELRGFPASSHTTMIGCEEGWTYIAEWTGVPLSFILDRVGTQPGVRYVVYRSIQPDWWESIDMDDALHPQTLIAHRMNGDTLPVPFGGPLRLRLPRQLGYKSVKYLNSLTLTDNVKQFGKGLGSAEPEVGYSWYAGI